MKTKANLLVWFLRGTVRWVTEPGSAKVMGTGRQTNDVFLGEKRSGVRGAGEKQGKQDRKGLFVFI
ncbi:MAG TPA: hypothetical protein VI298_05015 [Geobacteraceae bacterium]